MSPAKVTLSPKERELVMSTDWILTKNDVIRKVYGLFGGLSEAYRAELEKHPSLLMDEPGFRSPKIAKGEQYRGLPWVMLDHPRHFTTTDTLAIRSFFLWGNYGSITLQLSGIYLEKYIERIQQYFDKNSGNAKQSGWHIGIGNDPWQHHFDADNYQLLEKWEDQSLQGFPFLKLAKKISIDQWDEWPVYFEETYREILTMLTEQ